MNKLVIGASVVLSFSLFAEPLPEDLQKLKETFDAVVVDPGEQDEFELGWEQVEFGPEESLHLKKIIQKEIQGPDVDEEDSYTLESFRAASISLTKDAELASYDKSYFTPESLAKVIYTNPFAEEGTETEYGPFYCGALKINQETGEYFSKGCLEETKKLMDKLLELKLSLVLVTVEGNWWGDYEYKALYVQSDKDPKRYVRLSFDILHEI